MVLGWSAPALEMLKAEAMYTDEELSWVAGIPPLGSLVSMMLMALTLDRFGRKAVMLALVPPFVLGWLLLAFFRSIPLLLAGRFITGFCGAGYCTAAPVYTGEIAEKQIRGALGVFYQLMLTLGFLLAYFVGKLTGLRVLSLLCGIVPLVFFVAFFAMPESPVYLLDRERREDAVKALQWLRGPATDISQELASMDELIADSRRHKDSIKEKMGKKSTRRALMIGLGLMFAQQLTGVSIISFHSKTIFTAAGDTTDSTICFSVMGIMQVLAVMMAIAFVDRVGRRQLMKISLMGVVFCLVALGLFFFMKDLDATSVLYFEWLPLLILSVYLYLFTLGAGPLPWAMMGELFPAHVKGVCSSICGASSFVLAYITCETFAHLMGVLTLAGTFWLYAGLCFLSAVWLFFFLAETKGKSLEEIQHILSTRLNS
ncbi:facilitated trehalose transporter Tret1-like [Schistocerca piceifrons]|uniref:facilitated trehalose transporter Tret1-like n=1 Tax=Schistocerca piceifrons TaxID=274613 RepID=UPI001F5F66BF|nr:facilitated trehalose transporter Tret1-like [Schistocerca piceifrons]